MRKIEKQYRPVKKLPPEVARKIAAGEVIDRPNAIVRELLDNAVDSGADSILLEIEGGGIDKIRVVDNGSGMTKEDLLECVNPHATSKISNETDLLNLSTLGFRGEALASIAAVSNLQITTAYENVAWKLEVDISKENKVTPANLTTGTIVQSESLFQNFPARRIFLKRPASESLLCKQMFIEKSIPRTDISFRLTIDGKQRIDLPKNQSLAERFTSALELSEKPNLFYEVKGESPIKNEKNKPQWNFTLLIGEPAVFRNDKKLLFIYVNGRRISEYSLIQAIEYGATGFFPNGTHPIAALFLEIDSSLVDFNIHPAKKEARFKDIGVIHHAISTTTRNFFKNYTISNLKDSKQKEDVSSQIYLEEKNYQQNLYGTSLSLKGTPTSFTGKIHSNKDNTDNRQKFFSDSYSCNENIFHNSNTHLEEKPIYNIRNEFDSELYNEKDISESTSFEKISDIASEFFPSRIKYIGSALGVFLIAEKENCLYLIDQHAAHERILFNKFISEIGTKQKLLIPYVLETQTKEEDDYLEKIKNQLNEVGFEGKNVGEGRWEFYSIPSQWKGTEKDLEQDILAKRILPEQLLFTLAATNACRTAIKDGNILDDKTAKDLVEEALSLSEPYCPHGRPIWKILTKDDLFNFVRRTN